MYGGLQDNGSWQGPGYTWQNGDIKSWHWQMTVGGDGFDVTPDPENPRFGYGMSQGGNLVRYDSQTGADVFIKPTVPDLKTRLRFNWNAAFAINPIDKKTIYYGSQFVHKSTDKGNNWEVISTDLTTNNKSQQKASDETGGLTLDITSAENHNTILCIAPSPKQEGVLWVGTDDGNVHVSKDGGKTWTNCTANITGLPKESWIPQIRASSFNAAEAFVVANNYRQGDMSAYIFRTNDYGQTWNRMVDDKNVTGYALAVQQDTEEPNLIFVGTEQGLYVSIDNGSSFTQWKSGFPSVSTMDLAIQEREADLVIATFGRSIYVLDNIRPLRQMAKTNNKIVDKKISAFQPSTAYLANYRDPAGAGFGGDANFSGENKKKGVSLAYFYNAPKKDSVSVKPVAVISKVIEKKKGKAKPEPKPEIVSTSPMVVKIDSVKKMALKKDTVFVKISSSEGKLIRTLQHKPDSTGYQVLQWDLAEKEIRFPGTPKPKKDAEDTKGQSVLPGEYKIVFLVGDAKDSTYLEVKSDPRVKTSLEVTMAQKSLISRIEKSINKLTEATDRLAEAEEIAKLIQAQTKDKEGKEVLALAKECKTIQDSIKVTRELITGKKMEKQGYGRPYQLTPQSKLSEAMNHITAKQVNPTSADLLLVEQFETLTKESIAKVNSFFINKWAEFRKKVEATPLKTFKDYDPISEGN